MADTKGNDSKPNETRTGPVKPPVLDLKARESATDKPEAKGDAKAEVAERLTSGRSEIETQTAAAREALSTEAESLADKIAAGILKS